MALIDGIAFVKKLILVDRRTSVSKMAFSQRVKLWFQENLKNLGRIRIRIDPDPDPNLFGSCSDLEQDLDPDPNGHENQNPDPDPNKVASDPQHWLNDIPLLKF